MLTIVSPVCVVKTANLYAISLNILGRYVYNGQ